MSDGWYIPLETYLRELPADQRDLTLRFAQIEGILNNRERYDLARKHVREAGLSQRVTCIQGDAHVELGKIEGPFDFVFMEADKEGQMDYFKKLFPKKLIPGGILSVHNAIRQANSMRDYLEMIRKHPDFATVFLSVTMDDGFCLSYRHRMS